jgi:eukaryotic-like serine/threonine-protein kinase
MARDAMIDRQPAFHMQSIGKYEILEKIGVGGFGVVYKGYDPYIKRFVAIKTCSTDDEEIRHRFFREAEISGNLQHRNIVTVYDFGIQDEVPYLIQEYLTGEDLDRKVKRHDELTYPEKILYLVQIARGLEYAHSKGIVHRDIKPANVRILEDGTAKIMDFGIARLAHAHSGLTQTGMTLGTAAYLAPEQIRGEAVDARTDIFSFGILAYELFTYQRPFGGEVISAVLYQILNAKARPLASHGADCPAELSRIVERAMEKEPHRRYQSCAEVLRDLDALLRQLRAERGRAISGAGAEWTASTSSPLTATASGAATAPLPAPAAPADLDLAYQLDSHRKTPRSISTSAAYRQKEIPWGAWGIAAVLLVLMLAGSWWYWQRSRPPQVAAGGTAVAAGLGGSAPASRDGAADPVPAAAPPETGAPSTAAGADPAADPPADADADATPSATTPGEDPAPPPATAAESTAAPAAPAPEPPPAPKPPEKGTLVLAAAWDPQMTATVDGGAARRLDRQQTVQVAPGDHVVTFALVLPDYQDLQEQQVRVRPGQRLAVESPIERPGRLTVQAAIESPQGMVVVDGQSLGLSPRLRHPLRPGSHQVQITPLAAGATPRVAQVDVRSDALIVVTFDLRRDEAPRITEQAPTGS